MMREGSLRGCAKKKQMVWMRLITGNHETREGFLELRMDANAREWMDHEGEPGIRRCVHRIPGEAAYFTPKDSALLTSVMNSAR